MYFNTGDLPSESNCCIKKMQNMSGKVLAGKWILYLCRNLKA